TTSGAHETECRGEPTQTGDNAGASGGGRNEVEREGRASGKGDGTADGSVGRNQATYCRGDSYDNSADVSGREVRESLNHPRNNVKDRLDRGEEMCANCGCGFHQGVKENLPLGGQVIQNQGVLAL